MAEVHWIEGRGWRGEGKGWFWSAPPLLSDNPSPSLFQTLPRHNRAHRVLQIQCQISQFTARWIIITSAYGARCVSLADPPAHICKCLRLGESSSVCIDQLFFLPPTCTCFSLFVILSTWVPQKIKDPLHINHPFSACVYLSLKMTNQSSVTDVRQMFLLNIVPIHWQKARGKRPANPWREMWQFVLS